MVLSHCFPEPASWLVLIAVTWIRQQHRNDDDDLLSAASAKNPQQVSCVQRAYTGFAKVDHLLHWLVVEFHTPPVLFDVQPAVERERLSRESSRTDVAEASSPTPSSPTKPKAGAEVGEYVENPALRRRRRTEEDKGDTESTRSSRSSLTSTAVTGTEAEPGPPTEISQAAPRPSPTSRPSPAPRLIVNSLEGAGIHFRTSLRDNGAPEHCLTGPYQRLSLVTFTLAEILALVVLPVWCAVFHTTDTTSDVKTTSAARTSTAITSLSDPLSPLPNPELLHRNFFLHGVCTLWGLVVLLYVYRTCRWALTTFTLLSWSLATTRHLLTVLTIATRLTAAAAAAAAVPARSAATVSAGVNVDDIATSAAPQTPGRQLVLAYKVCSALSRLLRFPAIGQNVLTVFVWWGLVVPALAAARWCGRKPVWPWIQANLSPFFLNVHLLNLVLALSCEWIEDGTGTGGTASSEGRRAGRLTIVDLCAGFFFAAAYGLFYNCYLDGVYGIHYYLFLNLRSKFSAVFYVLVVPCYVGMWQLLRAYGV